METIEICINGEICQAFNAIDLSYEDICELTQVPLGSSVFYMSTKGDVKDRRAGTLDFRQKIELEEGLFISAMDVITDEESA